MQPNFRKMIKNHAPVHKNELPEKPARHMNGKRSEKETNNKHANQSSGTNVMSIVQAIWKQLLKAFVVNMLKAYAVSYTHLRAHETP